MEMTVTVIVKRKLKIPQFTTRTCQKQERSGWRRSWSQKSSEMWSLSAWSTNSSTLLIRAKACMRLKLSKTMSSLSQERWISLFKRVVRKNRILRSLKQCLCSLWMLYLAPRSAWQLLSFSHHSPSFERTGRIGKSGKSEDYLIYERLAPASFCKMTLKERRDRWWSRRGVLMDLEIESLWSALITRYIS